MINQTSFKGLWRGPLLTTEHGRDKRCKNGAIYNEVYEYCPFKDETNEQAMETAMKMQRSVFALDDKRDEDPWGPEAYYMPEVKMGERLNITAEDYANLQGLKSDIYQDTTNFKFSKLSTDEAGKLLKYQV